MEPQARLLHTQEPLAHPEADMPLGNRAPCGPEDLGSDSSTLVLKVGYRGARFSGFAAQEGQPTIAGELNEALSVLLRRPAEVVCAGRTDAGVSALGQYVSLPVSARERRDYSAARLLRSLDALTSDDISLRGVWEAPAGFSARFDAEKRCYRYRIATGSRPVMAQGTALWVRQELDLASMDEATGYLVGEHDFKSFCKAASAEGKSTCREILRCQVSAGQEYGEALVYIDVEGNAFLHNMVRIITGTLLEVGAGRRAPSWVGEVLSAADRRAAGPTAPPEGLFFIEVHYPNGLLRPW